MVIPYVVDNDKHWDVFSRLLKDRIIMLCSPIDTDVASAIIAQLLFLSNQDPDSDIKLYINSPGGEVSAGLSIISTMNLLKCDVETICLGTAASMAAVILSNGAKGKRRILEYGTVMIHQPSGGIGRSSASDIEIVAKNILKCKGILNGILSKNTGQPLETIEKHCDRDYYLDASEAVAYGIVDEIIGQKKSE